MKSPLIIVVLVALLTGAFSSSADPKQPLPPAQLEAAELAKQHFEHGKYRELDPLPKEVPARFRTNDA